MFVFVYDADFGVEEGFVGGFGARQRVVGGDEVGGVVVFGEVVYLMDLDVECFVGFDECYWYGSGVAYDLAYCVGVDCVVAHVEHELEHGWYY